MKPRKSKKKDQDLIELVLQQSKKSPLHHGDAPLLEQLVECILGEGEATRKAVEKLSEELKSEFVDWNEIRLGSADRLDPHFAPLENGTYKRKSIQALLNKVFSRSGSLDFQFLLDLETDALEDYLAGIMELSDSTRKRITICVFKKPVLPLLQAHELILERVGTVFAMSDGTLREAFAELGPEERDGVKNLFDRVLGYCAKDKPQCSRCPLRPLCIFGNE